MRIYIFEAESWERDALAELAADHDLAFADEPLGRDNASDYRDAEAISTFVYSAVDRQVLGALPRLELVASRSTGVDHIDLAACAERGIAVCNVPSYGTHTVAEHVFGLLLVISHRLEEAIERTRRGDFSSRGLQGFDLRGKVLGVVGTGDIGRATIGIARGFGMEVVACDVAPDESAAAELGFRYAPLKEVLAASDVVTLHVPATPQTYHLLSNDELNAMKPGAVLINTARGDVVDVRALARALAEGRIAAAGLDVLPEEPVIREEAEVLRSIYEHRHDLATLLADQVLVRMRNVVVTPHSAFNTREAVQRILDTTIENILAFARGTPQNTVAISQ